MMRNSLLLAFSLSVRICRTAAMALVCLLLPALPGMTPDARAAPMPITVLTIDGAIGPANSDYVVRGMARAAQSGSQLIILQMDTPGGLDTAMRSIIKAILSSPVPVVSYVAPSGAHAASAGTYILYASHFAAMAPGTNLGAATPIEIGGSDQGVEPTAPGGERRPRTGGTAPAGQGDAKAPDSVLKRKQINDATAYIRGLAQMRGRNADWAEQAVREAVSLPAQDALKLGVINYLAPDVPALLAQLDGQRVVVLGQEKQLQTKGAAVAYLQPDWRTRLLSVITTPTLALLLMTLGVYGLVFEFMSPGAVAPGVVGAICLLLALYGLQLLPVNYAGLALILVALGLMVAEAFLPSYGVLGVGGIVAFTTGALMLIDTDAPGFGIPLSLIVVAALASALLLIFTSTVALRTRRRKRVAGLDDMTGAVAQIQALADAPGEGWAQLRGESWQVVSQVPLQRKQKVRVLGRKGLVLEVAPLEPDEQGE